MLSRVPPLAVLFGVSGSGKSSVGAGVARAFAVPFLEGDELHDPASVAKMRAGRPLDEADRGPWLDRIRAWIDARAAAGGGAIVACSALTRGARATLRRPELRFVLLEVDPAVLAERLRTREHAYMPASLLPSQLATFEAPTPDEYVLTVRAEASVEAMVSAVVSALART